MDRVLREWDKIMPSEYCSDQACTNIGRIMRLPWTVNQKNWATCSIIEKWQQSSLVSFLPAFAKKEKEEKIERDKKRKEEWEKKVKSYWNLDNDDNIYQLILDIPAYELSQMLLPQFKYTGNRNFLSDTRQGNQYTAFYYSEDKNCIINWGSSHYNWWSATSWWDSFQLVKKFFNWTSRETFTHFKKLINK